MNEKQQESLAKIQAGIKTPLDVRSVRTGSGEQILVSTPDRPTTWIERDGGVETIGYPPPSRRTTRDQCIEIAISSDKLVRQREPEWPEIEPHQCNRDKKIEPHQCNRDKKIEPHQCNRDMFEKEFQRAKDIWEQNNR